MSLLRRAAVWPIRLYQLTISPDHSALGKALYPGGYCKYQPSCSAYAEEAILRHGTLRGSKYALMRVFRCAPWNPGGHDPVPPVRAPR